MVAIMVGKFDLQPYWSGLLCFITFYFPRGVDAVEVSIQFQKTTQDIPKAAMHCQRSSGANFVGGSEVVDAQ